MMHRRLFRRLLHHNVYLISRISLGCYVYLKAVSHLATKILKKLITWIIITEKITPTIIIIIDTPITDNGIKCIKKKSI